MEHRNLKRRKNAYLTVVHVGIVSVVSSGVAWNLRSTLWKLSILVPAWFTMCLSYLFLRYSDPGYIYDECLMGPGNMGLQEVEEDVETWCKICAARRPRRSHHCRACDQCVAGFDHHCNSYERKRSGHCEMPYSEGLLMNLRNFCCKHDGMCSWMKGEIWRARRWKINAANDRQPH